MFDGDDNGDYKGDNNNKRGEQFTHAPGGQREPS